MKIIRCTLFELYSFQCVIIKSNQFCIKKLNNLMVVVSNIHMIARTFG